MKRPSNRQIMASPPFFQSAFFKRALWTVLLISATLGALSFHTLSAQALVFLAFGGMILEWRALCLRNALTVKRPLLWFVFGGFYILIATTLAWTLVALVPEGRGLFFVLLTIVWTTDIAAYLVGSFVGGAKLCPAISPKKTWSGALGGLLVATLVGAYAFVLYGQYTASHVSYEMPHGLFAYFVTHPLPYTHALLLSAILSLSAQGGDLLESWMKRRFGIKDTSALIPGHGGILDRLDSILAVLIVFGVFLVCT